MSDLRHPFSLPPVAQDLAHADTQFACLRRHLIKLCGLWAKPQVAFIDAYFDAVLAHVAQREAALAERIGDLAGLVEPAHWCFAAPMPLPRAHLPVSPEQGPNSQVRQSSVRVDVLFRDSAGLIALSLSQSTPTTRQKREIKALDAAGIRVLSQVPLASGAALLQELGPNFSDFTHDIDFPESPFHGMGVPAPI